MRYLLQFEIEKKHSKYWMPFFMTSENKENVDEVGKRILLQLKDNFDSVNSYSIEQFNEDLLENKVVKSYIEDERKGEFFYLKVGEKIEIKEVESDANREIKFDKNFFIAENSKEVISYLDLKKDTMFVREIKDNIDNFDTYLIVKLNRIAGYIKMDPKKNPKADLERLKGVFMATGLLVSMIVVYAIVNMKFYDVSASELGQLIVEQVEEEIIPITQQNTPPPPPPPPPAAPEIIQVVENEVEVAEVEMIDTEADATTVVEEFTVKEEVVEEEIFTIVESMPEFPGGGQEALFKYLQKEMKYPQVAKENGIQGTVFVNFVVGKDGKIRDVKILRGVNKMLDDEAIRVVKAMPAWSPGKQRGKSVSVSYNLPIKFTLK